MGLLTVKEVADYLKMNPQVIRRWLRGGKLPGYKVGKEWRVSKEDVNVMLEKAKQR